MVEFKEEVGDIKNSLHALLKHLGIPQTTTSSTGSQQSVEHHLDQPVDRPVEQPVVTTPEVVPAPSPTNQNQDFSRWCTNLGL
ncbi:unnamed protein product [Cochlearia groenlandica]